MCPLGISFHLCLEERQPRGASDGGGRPSPESLTRTKGGQPGDCWPSWAEGRKVLGTQDLGDAGGLGMESKRLVIIAKVDEHLLCARPTRSL